MNPFEPTSMFPDGDATSELKARFAVALLRNPDEPFKAGVEVFGAETGKALFAAQNWINDEFVLAKQTDLLKTKGARAFLPSKEDYARAVWRLSENERTPVEERRHLLSLFGDIMGFKTQAEKSGINLSVTQNRVMVVKHYGSEADWERSAMSQQEQMQQEAIDVPARRLN